MAYTTIDDPEAYFQCKIYTGTGSSNAFTLDGDTDLSPNLVWIKHRGEAHNHYLYDTVRGVQLKIASNTNAAEMDMGSGSDAGLTAFGSDGFTIGGDTDENASSESYVAWCWKESATAGFDIVSYEGTGSAHMVSHSLSVKPKMIIATNRERTSDLLVYHAGMDKTGDYTLFLNSSSGYDNTQNYWGDTEATTSQFSVGTRLENNYSGEDIIVYCFADVQGFSKFGTYVANDNIDGPFIFCGFRPAWIMIKEYNASGNHFHIYDNKREGYNGANDYLEANNTTAEQSGIDLDILSNGFKIRTTGNDLNEGTYGYVYAAFAEAPFVNSKGVPGNAR
jgi:hypothetical protein